MIVLSWLYAIGIRAYALLVRLASLGSPKARQWLRGRHQWRQKNHSLRNPLWFHCASLGEFEQARPIIESLKQHKPELQILLTFYSPSGYEPRKDYPFADHICYLPLDTPVNARDFLDKYQPRIACFVKYEFWYFFLRALHQRGTPTFLIAGIFRPDQLFFRPAGAFYRSWLRYFTHFLVQNESSGQLLRQNGLSNWTVSGDPRADRVLHIAQEPFQNERLAAFCQNHPTLIVGSSWPADEEKILAAWPHLPNNWKLLFVPHELSPAKLHALQKNSGGLLYSDSNPAELAAQRVLILDTMGMLSKVYRYARLCYIGGGFGRGIHNILEAAVYQKPVLFGPRWQKFAEAHTLLENGGAFSISSSKELIYMLEKLQSEPVYQQAAAAQKKYFQQQQGATLTTIRVLTEYF